MLVSRCLAADENRTRLLKNQIKLFFSLAGVEVALVQVDSSSTANDQCLFVNAEISGSTKCDF